jgi:hypothetical protein
VSFGGKKPAVELYMSSLHINEEITSILIFLAICKVILIRINVSSKQVRLKPTKGVRFFYVCNLHTPCIVPGVHIKRTSSYLRHSTCRSSQMSSSGLTVH